MKNHWITWIAIVTILCLKKLKTHYISERESQKFVFFEKWNSRWKIQLWIQYWLFKNWNGDNSMNNKLFYGIEVGEEEKETRKLNKGKNGNLIFI